MIGRMMEKRKFTPLQILVHVGAWLPLAWLAWDYFNNNLTVNPIQALEQRTGHYAIVLLILSLACTPLNTVFGFRQAIKVRRSLGLYAFLYAALHFSIFIGLDYVFDWSLLREAIFEKRYTLVGFLALVILALLALTSFDWWKARLRKNWKRLHQMVYVASVLVVLHYAWALKGDIFRVQGNVWLPLLAGAVVAILLILRLPPVRRAAVRLRAQLARRSRPHKGDLAKVFPRPE